MVKRVERWELCSGVHALTTGCGWGHFIGFLSAEGGMEFLQGATATLLKFQIAVLGTASHRSWSLCPGVKGVSTVMLHQELWSEELGAHGIL